MNTHVVSPEQSGNRIDKLLAKLNTEYSRTQVRGWIDQQLVTVNEETVKANYKCQNADRLAWSIPKINQTPILPEQIPLEILYEDQALLVINKPRGMVVHPSPGHAAGTLVNALLHHTSQLSLLNGEERAGIVHRLDKDTSGLLVIAKTEEVHSALAEQLAAHEMERRYEAIVHGIIEHEQGLIDAPIGRDPKNRQNMAVTDNGKQAVTHFHVLHRYADYTHVGCELETGRTHQIRVHMKYIGHPIAGDPKYGRRKTLEIDGQALHACKVGFTHPEKEEWMVFETEPPEVFRNLLGELKNKS